MATPNAPVNDEVPGGTNHQVPGSNDDTLASLSQLSVEEYLPTNIPENLPDEKKSFRIACAKRAYLDGKYFHVDFQQSKPDGNIVAVCKTCVPTKTITGRLTVSSNYTTHLRVSSK